MISWFSTFSWVPYLMHTVLSTPEEATASTSTQITSPSPTAITEVISSHEQTTVADPSPTTTAEIEVATISSHEPAPSPTTTTASSHTTSTQLRPSETTSSTTQITVAPSPITTAAANEGEKLHYNCVSMTIILSLL